MNHCYRLVFNAAAHVWQAVAETTKSHRKSRNNAGKAKAVVSVVLLVATNAYAELAANALPTGAQVAAGQVTFLQTGNQLNIHQASQKAITNWSSFNIGTLSEVNFLQNNASAISLNRVLSSDPSQIFGKLNANGQVWLINSSGILFGQSAQVNVGSLLASTLNIADDDFINGNYQFTGSASNNGASIVNMGKLTAQNAGYIAMFSPQIRNEGIITALEGASILASGDAVSMSFNNNGLINVQVDSANINTLIENKNLIRVGGGQVLMSSKAADNLMTSVINNTGRIEADSITNDGGVIRLTGAKTVINSGEISAQSTIGKGGTVHMLGENVGVFDAGSINVNGKTGGGTILVGGDAHGLVGVDQLGKNSQIQNAKKTFVSQNATLSADATENGDGGKVIVWADDTTRYYGSISAKGGAVSGNGGFVEVSGKRYLDFIGKVDLTAYHGVGGKLLIDPLNILLDTTTQAPPPNNANGTPDVAFGDAPVAGTTTIQIADITGYSEAFFQATNNIRIANPLTMAINNSIRLEAGNNITVDGLLTTTGTGAVTLRADADNTGAGTLAINAAIATDIGGATLSGASVTSTATSTINTTGAANANGGNVVITSTGAVTLLGAVTASGGTAAAANAGKNAGNVTITGASVQTAAVTANGSNGNGTNQVGGNAGVINLTATAGNVNVTGAAAATRTLQARNGSGTGTGVGGAAGSVNLSGANITVNEINTSGLSNGNGGTIIANTTGILTLNNALNSSGGGAITGNVGRNAGNINLTGNTISAVAAGTITANGSNGLGANQAGGNAGTVTINGTGALSLRAITANGGNGVATNGGGGNAGVISIGSTAGAVDMNGTTLTARNGTALGTGTAGAAGSVSVAGTAVTLGAVTTTGNTKGNGGSITATASTGVLTLNGIINSSGGAGVAGTTGGNAGAVNLTGNSIASAAAGTVTASGGTGGSNAGGGAGATVTINSTNNASIRAVTASGGNGVATNGAGGASGSMNIISSAGIVNTNAAALTARTGAASGAGASGAAGSVNVTGAGLTLGAINTSRGSTSGTGGNVNVTTTGAATSTVASINADNAGAVNMNVADTLTVSGAITGTNSVLTKTGAGTLVLSGVNTYTGATNINVGTLRANNGAALGAVGGGTTIANGATLNVNNVTLAESALTINGAGDAGAGALTGTGTANVSGTVATASDSRIGTTSAASTLNITGVVTAPNNLGIVGAGNVTATNALNNFSTVNINGANNFSLRDTNGIILGNGTSNLTGNLSLQTAGAITQTDGITVGGATTLNAGATNDITLNNPANNFNTVAATGRNISLVDANTLTLNASNVSTIVAQTLSGNLTLGGNVAATGAGDAIVLASAANFINASNSTLTPGTGRWLVYSADPALDTRGVGLLAAYDFKQYNTVFGGPILGTGDGFVYTIAPTIAATLTGSATKVYDGNTTAPIGGLALGQSGAIDGDTVSLSALTSATYDNKNVGTGKTVTTNTLSITGVTNGVKPVFGFQLASTTASGALGTINKADAIVTANSNTVIYNGAIQSVTGFTASGLVGGETSAVLTGVTTNGGTGQNAGAYTHTASGLDTNYNLSFIDGALNINKANAIVTANSNTVIYNGAIQSVTGFTASGLVGGETSAVLTGVTTTGGSGQNAGAYTHTASGLDTNYNLSFIDGALNINKAALNVAANNATKTQGSVNPAFSSTITGFVGGETSTVLIGTLNHSTPAVTSSPAGIYAITPFGLSAANYDITFVNGVLTVTNLPVVNNGGNFAFNSLITRPEQAVQVCGGRPDNNNVMITGLDTFDLDDVEYKQSVTQPLVGGVVANALISPSCLKL